MGFIVILPHIQIICFWSYSLLLHFLLHPSLSSSTCPLHFTFSVALTSIRQNMRDLFLFMCFILLNLSVQLQQPSCKQCHFSLWFKFFSLIFCLVLYCLISSHLVPCPAPSFPPLPFYSLSIPLFSLSIHWRWASRLILYLDFYEESIMNMGLQSLTVINTHILGMCCAMINFFIIFLWFKFK